MLLKTLLDIIEEDIPLSKAESWDNSGLQAGRRDKDIKKIYIALDPTEEVIDHAIACKADLLLTHHPMTLSGLKKIHTDDFIAKKFFKAIRADLCCYAMHTNYDVMKMGDIAADILGIKNAEPLEVTGILEDGRKEGIGRSGEFENPMSLFDCARLVKREFHLSNVKVFGDPEKMIQKVSICPGSGKSLLQEVYKDQSELYITGDIGHHDGLDAMEQGICVIDAGHYGLEHIFIENMKQYLNNKFDDLEIFTDNGTGPFQIM